MNNISNEEKAREIAEYTQRGYLVVNTDDNTEMISTYNYCYDSAMQMAQWKDEQFAKEKEKVIEDACEKIMQQAKDDYKFIKKEKQQWIDKACDVYADLLSAQGCNIILVNNEVVRLKQAMEE